mgnify:CR=1 FL=1|tara:strand:+ start:37096 stop:37791 length:696 start_codon:yes stop_codon:yes gene_type:complete
MKCKVKDEGSCLLIGNSRWHWGFKENNEWKFISTSKKKKILQYLEKPLWAWATVGKIPQDINLDPSLQIELKDIPLLNTPPWLGVDRALAAWGAYSKSKEISKRHQNGLLVADAGTVFSLTRVNCKGEFIGGQLVAGMRLQLKAMAKGTKNLQYPEFESFPRELFPISTSNAMLKGTLQSLIGTLIEANRKEDVPIWLCGGDSPIIFKELEERQLEVFHYPNLALEGMIEL